MPAERRLAGTAHSDRVETAIEVGGKRLFHWVLDWPGWCRSGKTQLEALESLIAYGERYNVVVARAGFEPMFVSAHDVYVVETVPGGAGTDFGVPCGIATDDRRPVDAVEAARFAGLVEAAWSTLDDIVADAPLELRKGPRGGGRDRDRIVRHVDEADHAYSQVMGIKLPAPDRATPSSVEALHAAMLEAIRQPSDGSPIAGRRWPPRYAARRIAWHALDHAWEIEDRTEP